MLNALSEDKIKINSQQILKNEAIVFIQNNIGLIQIIIIIIIIIIAFV